MAKGYRIIDRNYRKREGEIDIIAQVGDILAFVEVKCRRGAGMGKAIEALTRLKQRRLLALAETYGQGREGLPEQRRIDLIAIDVAPDGRVLSLEHVEGAVWDE